MRRVALQRTPTRELPHQLRDVGYAECGEWDQVERSWELCLHTTAL